MKTIITLLTLIAIALIALVYAVYSGNIIMEPVKPSKKKINPEDKPILVKPKRNLKEETPVLIKVKKKETPKETPKPTVRINPVYSTELIEGIKHFECNWLSKKADDYVTKKRWDKLGKKWEIGYGFTNDLIETAIRYKVLKKGFTLPEKMTKKECDEFLEKVAIPTFHEAVKKHVDIPITSKQRDALIMFAYNFGDGTLRRLVDGKNRLNGGKINNTPKIMKRYCYAGGKVVKGLRLRRAYEIKLFNDQL